jgi:hypothetical protein
MNVLECANCLDERSTQWKFDKETRVPIRILKYEFRSDRFPESTFFKIPETAAGEILTVTGLKDTEDEFKPRVENLELKGLLFERLWSGGQPDARLDDGVETGTAELLIFPCSTRSFFGLFYGKYYTYK